MMRKKPLLLSILPLLILSALSPLSVNIVEVSAIIPPEPEYPAIYVDPPIVENIMPPNNFTISIKTNYNGTDMWSWQFTLTYNTSVLHGGIRGTDMWTGDGVTKTFDTTGKPVVPDSEVIHVNEKLMTRKSAGNDTWTGDGVTKTFPTTKKLIVSDSEVVHVNETLMTRKSAGNDTWTGDGVTKIFYTTKKPLFSYPEELVYVNAIAQKPNIDYVIDYSEGKIEFKDTAIPANGAKVEAQYHYGHYTVDYSEGKIEFYDLAIPADGVEIEATYQYVQYAVDYAEGRITFTTAPSEGAKVEVAYLYGGVTNGDLITTAKDPSASFSAGTFNNTSGRLSLTYAYFFYIFPPIPVTSGPGTLATITFTVVGTGTSNITLVKPSLVGAEDVDTYIIIDETMPNHIGHGYFDNRAPYETRLHVRESPPGSWIPGVPVGQWVWLIVDIESPLEWDNTPDGIVGWVFSVHVDPDVLEPINAYSSTFGYFLFDFIDWNGYYGHEPHLLIEEINTTTGVMRGIGECIFGWESLRVGAGGNSGPGWYGETYGLCRLRFRSKSETACTRIDIYDAFWVHINESAPDGFSRIPFDVVEDAYYNEPPPFHSLTVESTPIDGIDFTIDSSSHTTNATVELAEGSYTVTMPSTWMVGPDQYNFLEWEDHTANPVRTISLTSDMTIIAVYELQVRSTDVYFNLNPNPISVGETVALKGVLVDEFCQPLDYETVELFARPLAGSWRHITSLTTDGYGTFTWQKVIPLQGIFIFAVYYPGTGMYRPCYNFAALIVQ